MNGEKDEKDSKKRIEELEKVQAVDAATQAGAHATQAAALRSNLAAVTIATMLTVTATAASGASSTSVRFGSDLTREANADLDCTRVPFDLSSDTSPKSGAQTCTYTASPKGRAPSGAWPAAGVAEGPLAVPKGRGRLTAMRVSVGAKSGPMQFVILRTLVLRGVLRGRLQVVRVCCKILAVSRVFTPNTNAVTTVKVNIPVRHDTRDPRPGGELLGIDAIGLSVLAAGVPVPVHDTLSENLRGGPPVVLFPAARTVGKEATRLAVGTDRYEVLINADWVRG